MKKKHSKTDIRPFTRQFYRGSAGCLALATAEIIMNVALSLAVAWVIQQILDLIAGYDTGYTLFDLTVFTAVCIAVNIVSYTLGYCAKPKFIARGIAQYKEYVFQRLTEKSIQAFADENSALYISALSNDANAIENGCLANIFPMLENVLMFAGALSMMFWYSPLLTVISAALSLLPVFASILAGNRAAEAEKEISDRNVAYMSVLRDSLAGFSVIKSFRAEARICRIFGENVKRLTDAKCRRQRAAILVQMLAQTAGITAQLGVFLFGAYLALSGRGVTVGTVMVFVQMMNYVLSPIAALPGYIAEYRAARELIRKLAEALPENVRGGGGTAPACLERGIALRKLSFAYETDKPVLRQLDFNFEAGKAYAVVGASGSGKSTLLNLLMAGNHGYTGSICYDGAELKEISSESLYEMVSVVQQNVFIFNASIRDNITMFSDFPKEEVDRAVKLSGLSELVAERGEDYLCGENGSGLSGGEKQRISIARSLLKRSQVLLADEATAALDARTAFQVLNVILDLTGVTRIVVTHLLDEALLKRCHCILAFKNGAVAEAGSFDELMDRKGYFYSLYTVSQ